LLVFFYGGVVPGMVTALVALIAPSGIAFTISLVLLLPYLFLFVATLHVSDYVSYREIFHGEEKADPAPPA
jgi:hypothetical protein